MEPTDQHIESLEVRVKQLETERQALQYALGSVVDILAGFTERAGQLLDLVKAATPQQHEGRQHVLDQLEKLRQFCHQSLVDSAFKEWGTIQKVLKLSMTIFAALSKHLGDLSEEEVSTILTILDAFIAENEGDEWRTLKEKLLKRRASGVMPPKSSS